MSAACFYTGCFLSFFSVSNGMASALHTLNSPMASNLKNHWQRNAFQFSSSSFICLGCVCVSVCVRVCISLSVCVLQLWSCMERLFTFYWRWIKRRLARRQKNKKKNKTEGNRRRRRRRFELRSSVLFKVGAALLACVWIIIFFFSVAASLPPSPHTSP